VWGQNSVRTWLGYPNTAIGVPTRDLKRSVRQTINKHQEDVILNIEEFMKNYWESYNRGDYRKTVSTYFAENVVFEQPEFAIVGSKNLADFWVEFHQGVKETLKANRYVIQGNLVAAELEATLDITEDRPDFLIGPVKKGDSFPVIMSAYYDLGGDKISHVKVYTFAPPILKK